MTGHPTLNRHARKKKDDGDVATPYTDKLIDKMLCGTGIPQCDEWDRMVEHARAMERLAYTYRTISVLYLKGKA